MESDGVNILCVAESPPGGPSGYGIRLRHTLSGLRQLGSVDLVIVDRPVRLAEISIEPTDQPERLLATPRTTRPANVGRALARWLGSGEPRMFTWHDWSTVRDELLQWRRPRYDLVWFGHAMSAARLGDLFVDCPTVVDFDDLEDEKIRSRRAAHAYRLDHGG